MKKSYLFLSFALAIVGCSRNQTLEQSEAAGAVFTAVQPEVKSHLGTPEDGKIPVLFDATDELWIRSDFDKTASKYTTTASDLKDGGRTAVFYGNANVQGPYVAAFPYAYVDGSASDNKAIVFNVPKKQDYNVNSFGICSNIAFSAWESGSTFTLHSVGGCLRVSVKGSGSVKKVVLSDNDSAVSLWGKCTVKMDNDIESDNMVTYANEAADRNEIEIELASPVQLSESAGSDFYFTVPFGSFEKGLTIFLYDEGGELIKAISTDKSITIKRGALTKMVEVNIDNIVPFSGGAGTEENPYRIATVGDLKQLAAMVNSATGTFASAVYSQTRDIYNAALEDHIGIAASPFAGTYHGNGHKITNISFSAVSNEKAIGLFGTVSKGLIDYLEIDGYTAPLTLDRQGVFVGLGQVGSKIDHCTLSGSAVSISSSQSGGIIGRCECEVTNCTVTAPLTAGKGVFGGIAGLTNTTGKITDCVVKTDINQISGLDGTGGILGYCESNVGEAVVNCEYVGSISAPGARFVGGILGKKNNRKATIIKCTSSGIISGDTYVGGIVGGSDGTTKCNLTIQDCISDATVTASITDAGGIIGASASLGLEINGCLSTGDIKAAYGAGGIAGYINVPSGSTASIVNCCYAGEEIEVTASNSNGYDILGGILGWAKTSGTVYIINNVSRVGSIRHITCDNDCATAILGVQTTTPGGSPEIYGCYSTITNEGFFVDGVQDKSKCYGVYGILASPTKWLINECYYDSSVVAGKTEKTLPESVSSFTDGEVLLEKLNKAVSAYTGGCTVERSKWVLEDDGLPMLTNFSLKIPEIKGGGSLPGVDETPGEPWKNR